MTELVKYEEARRLLAEAVAVDEVKLIRDQAVALAAYARQAKDREIEVAAAQIRFRAEQRLGEMIIAQKETVGLAKGGQPYRNPTCSDKEQVGTPVPTLEQAGIDRKLSSRAQRMARLPEDKFEELLERHADEVRSGVRVTMDLLKVGEEADGRERRRALQQALSDETARLPTGRRFPVIYADPPWHRKQGVTGRSYENHYPTMTWDDICALPVKDLLLPDAWVFLWIPRAHMFALHAVDMEFATDDGCVITRKVQLPLAWAVARAWGCDSYSTAFVWTKTDEEHPEDQGGGVITFDQDEILLLFKRGRGLPKPDTKEKFGSNHRERSKPLGHSRKPEFYREMIATMCGGLPVMELFARVDAEHPLPPKWEGWGNQTSPSSGDNEIAETVAPGSTADESTAGNATMLPVAAPTLSADDGLDLPACLRRTKSEVPSGASDGGSENTSNLSVSGDADREQQRDTLGVTAGRDRQPTSPMSELVEWKVLGAIDANVSISGPIDGLIESGLVDFDFDKLLFLTDEGKERFAVLEQKFNPAPESDSFVGSADAVDEIADEVVGIADAVDVGEPEMAGASAGPLPSTPDSGPDEFTILKAFANSATRDRFNIIGPVASDYIARGLVFKYDTITDWGLTAAGYDRLDELKRERAGLAPKVLTPPAVSDLSDDEQEMREVLAAIAGAYRSDLSATRRATYERDLIGLGFLSVIDDCGGLAVTEAGHAWLRETEAGSAPPPLTQPEPLTPVQINMFGAVR